MDAGICRVFIKTVEHGNITRAAAELGFTQAGVSLMVKKLEEECGLRLLNRKPSGVVPTAAAERLLPVMREMVNCDELFRQTAAGIRGITIGTVRVGCFMSVAYQWLPRVMKEFSALYPNIEVEIVEGGVSEIEGWIEERSVDIGFLSERKGQKFDAVPLVEDEIMAILPKGHPLACDKTFPLEAFGRGQFIVSKLEYDADSCRVVEEYRKRFGAVPNIKFSSTDDCTIISMVRNGLGISALPQMMLFGRPFGVVAKRIEPRFSRKLIMGAASLEEMSPAAAKFMNCAGRFLKGV